MDFERKLKIRRNMAVGYIIVGIILIGIGSIGKTEMALSFGSMFAVIGIAKLMEYKRITSNKETLRQREIAENDERNIMLWTKARSMAFIIYIIAAALVIVVLYLVGMVYEARIVSYSLSVFVVIYWVSYFVLSRKY